MANNPDNIQLVRPKTDGVAFSAASGTTLPTDNTTALASDFKSLGYVSEDGLTMTVNNETVDIKEFGGDIALNVQTSHSVEFKFKPLEWNDTVKKELFGADAVDSDGNVTIKADEADERTYVFDMRGRGDELIRICCPRLKMKKMGDLTFKASDPLAAEITFVALPDASGVKVKIY